MCHSGTLTLCQAWYVTGARRAPAACSPEASAPSRPGVPSTRKRGCSRCPCAPSRGCASTGRPQGASMILLLKKSLNPFPVASTAQTSRSEHPQQNTTTPQRVKCIQRTIIFAHTQLKTVTVLLILTYVIIWSRIAHCVNPDSSVPREGLTSFTTTVPMRNITARAAILRCGTRWGMF